MLGSYILIRILCEWFFLKDLLGFLFFELIKCLQDWAFWDGFVVFWVVCVCLGWVYIKICVKHGSRSQKADFYKATKLCRY